MFSSHPEAQDVQVRSHTAAARQRTLIVVGTVPDPVGMGDQDATSHIGMGPPDSVGRCDDHGIQDKALALGERTYLLAGGSEKDAIE